MIDNNYVPCLRSDFARENFDHEVVVWSPVRPEPTVLDPVTSVFLDIVDGIATIEQLVSDIRSVVGVSEDVARRQVGRHLELLDGAGLLMSSAGSDDFDFRREPFLTPQNT